ncbi:hypothetical protein [Magnetospira sp. QH-2]|uniref:hypothetical protein n=1 Tax=Magnetospira sp. (strain QH-2) TaxID=1288970 RepID=UPI0003E80E75|nr:hypothetical protein [Magnetospira sp. QH-2]CCQ73041.1 putative NADPH-dependent 7-cyano-7-deazaguanine reductase [Magnetospira sp. QH-2]
MEPNERRALLECVVNPDGRLDYVVDLSGDLANFANARVSIRYVPDKLIAQAQTLSAYLHEISTMDWPNLEQAAVTILHDLNNELVPRWVQVIVTSDPARQPGIASHSVMLEERQPKWDNRDLLSHLKRV